MKFYKHSSKSASIHHKGKTNPVIAQKLIQTIEDATEVQVLMRGLAYAQEQRIKAVYLGKDIQAKAIGKKEYTLRLDWPKVSYKSGPTGNIGHLIASDWNKLNGHCSCPAFHGPPCKHLVALVYALAHNLDNESVYALSGIRPPLNKLLALTKTGVKTQKPAAQKIAVTKAKATPSTPLAPAPVPKIKLNDFWQPPKETEWPQPLMHMSAQEAVDALGTPPERLGGAEAQEELTKAYELIMNSASRALNRL